MLPADRRLRIVAIAGIAALAVIALTLLLLAIFPVGLLKGTIEERLSRRFGRAVTIGSLERADRFGFSPLIVIRDVRIPQPAWAGTGDLARIGEARVGFQSLQLLWGQFAIRDVTVRDARINLIRTADGRENWRETSRRRGPGGSKLERLTIADTIVSYRDAKQDRAFVARLSSDAQAGFRLAGRGTVRAAAVMIAARGPAIGGRHGAWPFSAVIEGPALAIRATGRMARALDTGEMTLDVTARADDLKLIDAVIEAGLFETQPVSLRAHVERTPAQWRITGLAGTIGRSRFAGGLTVGKVDDRTKLDGTIRASLLDFDDLASTEGLAKAAAEERAIGPRIVPDTRIDIGKIRTTDGTIRFRIDRIVSREGPSSLTDAAGTLVLDRRLLTVAPLRIGMRQGAITGRAAIDQRDGAPSPLVTLDMRLRDSSIPALGGGGGSVTGRVDARAVLKGRGDTIRQVVGASSGRIGLVARDGQLPERIAAALGFDAGRAVLSGGDDRARLRCVILGLDVARGRGRIDPLVIDTSESRMNGTGSIDFPSEALSIRLTGAPKRGAVLRLPGSATMTGTISLPDVDVPREVKSVGNIFKAIGRAITGRQGPTATDADCAGLGRRVLR